MRSPMQMVLMRFLFLPDCSESHALETRWSSLPCAQ
jgi:hypothetical protein